MKKKLIGTNDIERYEVNAYGRRISQLEFQKGEKGKTLRLTIDTQVQQLANELLKDQWLNMCDGHLHWCNNSDAFIPFI